MKLEEIHRVGFIGAGKMAEGIIKGILQGGLFPPERIMAADIDTRRLEDLNTDYGIETGANAEAARVCDLLILAVKPQHAGEVFREIRGDSLKGKLFVSIMAGVPTRRIETGLGGEIPVVRVMPNIAATVQSAASAFCLGKWATPDHAAIARAILETFGTATQVNESLMDAVTGLSGSGPAYVFAFIEALADGGVMMGLPRDTALTLAVQTVRGAAELMIQMKEHPAILREKVTSPGGTTIHGLAEMERRGFRNAVIQAVKRATMRSEELGKDA